MRLKNSSLNLKRTKVGGGGAKGEKTTNF